MQIIKTNDLKEHSQNNYFFDDIQGDNWEQFKESIKTSGVIEPIVITQDKIIVSGHQRVRACNELGIAEIPCKVQIYDGNDKWSKDNMIIKDLLETNLRQRGIGNTNAIKLSRCIVELEKLYGIKKGGNGSNQHEQKQDNLTSAKTQQDLAEEIGIGRQQLQDYKRLLTLIPDLQDLIQDNKLSPTIGYKVLSKLSKEDQEKLINDFGKDYISQLTQKKAEELIKNKQPKIIDKTDYNTIDTLKLQISTKNKDIDNLKRDKDLLERKVKLNQNDAKKYNDLKKQIEFLNKEKEDISRQIQSAVELSGLTVKIDNFLKTELSPIRYSRTLERMDSEVAIKNLQDIIESVELWCVDMRKFLPDNNMITVEVLK